MASPAQYSGGMHELVSKIAEPIFGLLLDRDFGLVLIFVMPIAVVLLHGARQEYRWRKGGREGTPKHREFTWEVGVFTYFFGWKVVAVAYVAVMLGLVLLFAVCFMVAYFLDTLVRLIF